MRRKTSSVLGNAISLSLYVFIGRIAGFCREIIISYIYGNSPMSDAYVISNSFATVLFNGLFFGIMTAYIPICSECDRKEKERLTSNTINILFIFMLAIIIILFMFDEKILSLFVVGFGEEAKKYTRILVKYTIGSSIFSMILQMVTGYLNSESLFSFGGYHALITNIIMCVALLLTINNPYMLGVGYLFSVIGPTIWSIFLLNKYQFKYCWKISIDKRTKKLFLNSLPAFIGTNIIQLNVMIDKSFASSLGTGFVSALNYADLLSSFVINVIATSFATVIFTSLSEFSVQNKKREFVIELVKGVRTIMFIVVPITICLSILSPWIIDFLFGRGKFDASDIKITSEALQYYAFSIIGTALNQIIYRAFFSQGDNITPFICYTFGIIINVAMNYLLISEYKHLGLAIATSISVFIIFLIQIILFDYKYRLAIKKKLYRYFAKILICGLVMYRIMFLIQSKIEIILPLNKYGDILMICLVSCIGIMLYLIIAWILQLNEMKIIMLFLKKIKNEKRRKNGI